MVTFNIDRNYNYKTLADKLSELRLDYDPDNHLAVTTMFRTIQGEAPLAGMPAVFLRLAGCNRGAKGSDCYFCDTYFAVNETTRIMLVDEVVEELRQLSKGMELALLVITGGEPLLQARALSTLLDRLYDDKEDLFTMTQFETNGDQFVTAHGAALLEKINDINDSFFDEGDEYPELMPINVVISPKRAIVEPQGGTFLNYAEDPGFFLRLLVSGDPESKYYTVPEVFIENWPQNSFWLSPITEYSRQPADAEIADIRSDIDIEATRRNVARAIKLATQLGFRVSLQAHSYIGIA